MRRLQQQFQALGSDAFITLIADDDFLFEPTFRDLQQQIIAFERRFSRFLPDSELTRFNTTAGSDTDVSDEFLELLRTCKQMAVATDGLYNPFILPALQQAGYKGSWPSPQNLAGASNFSDRQVVPYSQLEIYNDTAQIPLHTALDFGGIGKGYLLDKLSTALQPLELSGYWISLGGDIVCAGRDLDGRGWSVQVQHATEPERQIATLTNTDGTALYIATSGITKRRGETSRGSWHHLIDPRTGLPAETDILTATITADSGVAADVYAKTIVIAGATQAAELKKSGEMHACILQYRDKEPTIEL